MLILQTPGTWIWLVEQLATKQHWSTWLSTFVAACQVSVLLVQVLYYDVFLKKCRKGAPEDANVINEDL